MQDRFIPSKLSKVRRLPKRGAYDRATIFAILDAGVMCHVGYVVDGRPLVTPTAYWRHGDDIYWHGSAASRMLKSIHGADVCVTVSHLDGLVIARSAFHQSVNYRSVMIFGTAEVIEGLDDKRMAMRAFVERLYPGRTPEIRESSDKELKAISLIKLTITEASAKVRDAGAIDDEEDYAIPTWAGVIPIQSTIGKAIPDQRLLVGGQLPASLAAYAENARLDDVLSGHIRP